MFESLWRHHIVSLCKTGFTLFSTGSTQETSNMAENFLTGMGGSRGGGGRRQVVRTTPERSQKNGFLSKTGPDPLKNRKTTRPEFNVRPSWRFAGGPMMTRF